MSSTSDGAAGHSVDDDDVDDDDDDDDGDDDDDDGVGKRTGSQRVSLADPTPETPLSSCCQ